jgi:hypothetical protein
MSSFRVGVPRFELGTLPILKSGCAKKSPTFLSSFRVGVPRFELGPLPIQKSGCAQHLKKKARHFCRAFVSGYQDSNLGPPAPKAGALTGLRYTPNYIFFT